MRRPGSPGEGAAGSAILLPDAVDDPALADTRDDRFARQRALPQQHLRRRSRGQIDVDQAAEPDQTDALPGFERAAPADEGHRSDERRVGKECVSPCSYRGVAYP